VEDAGVGKEKGALCARHIFYQIILFILCFTHLFHFSDGRNKPRGRSRKKKCMKFKRIMRKNV